MSDSESTFASRQPKSDLRDLTTLRAWPTVLSFLLNYAVVALAWMLAVRSASPLGYAAAVVVIGSRQHALAALMHEAVHSNLSRTKWLNDAAGQLLCAWPVFTDMFLFRAFHLAHHRHLGTARDPENDLHAGEDWRFPQTPRAFALNLLRDALGLNTIEQVRLLNAYGRRATKPQLGWTIGKGAFYAALVAVLVVTGAWVQFLVLWVLPIFTVVKVCLRLREVAEHVQGTCDLTRTRTTYASWLARVFIVPENLNFHIEHHLHPAVPGYNLPAAHARLQRDADYAARALVSPSYGAVLAELLAEETPVIALERVSVPQLAAQASTPSLGRIDL